MSQFAQGADAEAPATAPEGHTIAFGEALRVWARVAVNSFGGPAGQIAVMHRIVVEEKRWISENRFLHALNYCMLLPGPEAQQLATYIGWLLHRTPGGLAAGLLFVLPGFLAILALSVVYALYRDLTLVEGVFFGVKAAVLAIVVEAVLRIGRRALRNRAMVGIAVAAFVGIFLLAVPYPAIVAGAALAGWLGGRLRPAVFRVIQGHTVDQAALVTEHWQHTKPSWGLALRLSAVWLTLWFAPLLWLGTLPQEWAVFPAVGWFFSKAAVVTFGGAYSVLAYIAQAAVETYGWLAPGEMLDGLGLAETTPGPLIMVVQFVGFLAGFRNPGPLEPLTAAVLASVLTTWVTFVPCFYWIFLGAPSIEALRGREGLTAALSGITAAVVGVIANLGVWFGLHTLFARVDAVQAGPMHLNVPHLASVDLAALGLTALALLAVFRLRLGMLRTLGGCAILGAALRLAGL